ncbi:MAG: hypothetical protein U0795_14590 [Pirellulales bacterium]
MATVRMTLEEVVGYFDELEDPRSEINLKHPFVSVVVIAAISTSAIAVPCLVLPMSCAPPL